MASAYISPRCVHLGRETAWRCRTRGEQATEAPEEMGRRLKIGCRRAEGRGGMRPERARQWWGRAASMAWS